MTFPAECWYFLLCPIWAVSFIPFKTACRKLQVPRKLPQSFRDHTPSFRETIGMKFASASFRGKKFFKIASATTTLASAKHILKDFKGAVTREVVGMVWITDGGCLELLGFIALCPTCWSRLIFGIHSSGYCVLKVNRLVQKMRM